MNILWGDIMTKSVTLKSGLVIDKEDVPRFTSSRALLEAPLPEGFDVYALGAVSVNNARDTVFIDIDDTTPTMTLQQGVADAVSSLGGKVPMLRDVQDRKLGPYSLLSGGVFLRISDGQEARLALCQRSLYKGDDPNNGYIDCPLAEQTLTGRMSEPLSRTIAKEAGEELLVFLKARSPNVAFAQLAGGGRDPTVFTPLLISFDGRLTVTADEKSRQVDDFLAHTATRIDIIAGDLSYLADREIPAGKFGRDPVILNAGLYGPDLNRMVKVITRVNGRVFDETLAIPVLDTRGNTAEFYQSRILTLPHGAEIAYVTGMEPNPGRRAMLRTDAELQGMPLGPRRPWETGEKPGGLADGPFNYAACRTWDTQPLDTFCHKLPQMGPVLTAPPAHEMKKVLRSTVAPITSALAAA